MRIYFIANCCITYIFTNLGIITLINLTSCLTQKKTVTWTGTRMKRKAMAMPAWSSRSSG